MCCGSKRSKLKNTLSTAPATSNPPLQGAQRSIELGRAAVAPRPYSPQVKAPAPAQTSPSGRALEGSVITISYLERAPLRVRGLATGRAYEFSASNPHCEVDARDASALLNTRFFRRA